MSASRGAGPAASAAKAVPAPIVLHARRIALIVSLLLSAIVACVMPPVAFAQTGTYNPDTPADPATETRLRELATELRCLVCQNQNIADSNADLAVDLRREVRSQILQGKSDGEIKNYLVARYGDFVLYNPPMQANTALLWFGPLLLLVVGGAVWWVLIRRRSTSVPAVAVTAEDEQKAKSLLES